MNQDGITTNWNRRRHSIISAEQMSLLLRGEICVSNMPADAVVLLGIFDHSRCVYGLNIYSAEFEPVPELGDTQFIALQFKPARSSPGEPTSDSLASDMLLDFHQKLMELAGDVQRAIDDLEGVNNAG